MSQSGDDRRRQARQRRLNVIQTDPHPAYVVWELTLRCDHACTHCGSRAARMRPDELSTAQALDVVDQLAEMGAREVVLIGGEAYLHPGFLQVISALRARGVTPGITTGGLGVDPKLAGEMAAAGLARASVSIDGLAERHDAMRARVGSFARATAALDALGEAGIDISANTNFNRFNRDDMEALYTVLRDRGVRSWQVQLTAPLGRAADRPAMLLQPWDLLDLVPRLAKLKRRGLDEGLRIMPGNNLGYFGPEEGLLRSQNASDLDHFQGCQAGRFVAGIESSGAVKGCPSLQTTHYVGGSLRERTLRDIWEGAPELAFARARTTDDLWGFCKRCEFAATCLAGCSFTSHAFFGRPGNNPYCHYRARVMRARAKREHLVPREAARGTPFDSGLFELQVQDLDAPEPPGEHSTAPLLKLTRKPVQAGTLRSASRATPEEGPEPSGQRRASDTGRLDSAAPPVTVPAADMP